MKRLLTIISFALALLIMLVPAKVHAASEELGVLQNYAGNRAMPKLDVQHREISYDNAEAIDDILEQMNRIAIEYNNEEPTSLMRLVTSQSTKKKAMENRYDVLKAQAEALGCTFLTNDQAAQYVYGAKMPSLNATRAINYPGIQGITFSIYYYTYNGVKMAKCTATQTPGTVSKLVKNYDTVEMFDTMSLSSMADKTISMTGTRFVNYYLGSLVGGKVTFTINVIKNLVGDAFPNTSSSSEARLNLAVSTNSTVVHIWRYVNSDYYMRTSSVKAAVEETWTLRDTNGRHYTKNHKYTSYSQYYDDSARALELNNSQCYTIFQQYKAKGFLGIMWSKLEVSPYTAALPIHFAN